MIPRVLTYKSPYASNRTLAITPDLSMSAAILDGLSGSMSAIQQRLPFTCPSENCRWEPYETLAVCSHCIDVSFLLSRTTQDLTLTTNQNFILSGVTPSGWEATKKIVPWSVWRLPSINYIDLHLDYPKLPEDDPGFATKLVTLVQDASSLSYDALPIREMFITSVAMIQNRGSVVEPLIRAQECSLQLCGRSISSEVINGVLTEHTEFIASTKEVIGDTFIVGNFSILQDDAKRISNGLLEILVEESINVTQTNTTGYAITTRSGELWDVSPAAMQSVYNAADDLNSLFERLATSMTNNLRVNDANATMVKGTSAMTVYTIRWPWIALPLSMMVASCFLLLFTMSSTRKRDMPLWKCSSLPVLKCGAEAHGLLAGQEEVGAMEDLATTLLFSLSPKEVPHTTTIPTSVLHSGSRPHSVAASVHGANTPVTTLRRAPSPDSATRSSSRPVSVNSDAPVSPV